MNKPRIDNGFYLMEKAEELIIALDPDEKNEQLMELYRFIHSYNPTNSCYPVHEGWRKDFEWLFNQPSPTTREE